MPTPHQRVTAALGNQFGDAQSTRLNLWLSQKIVSAILALAEAAKAVSGGKILTQTYYGYHLALTSGRMAGSGHLALQTLMQSPHRRCDRVGFPATPPPTHMPKRPRARPCRCQEGHSCADRQREAPHSCARAAAAAEDPSPWPRLVRYQRRRGQRARPPPRSRRAACAVPPQEEAGRGCLESPNAKLAHG